MLNLLELCSAPFELKMLSTFASLSPEERFSVGSKEL
jgi:hypothetical protein